VHGRGEEPSRTGHAALGHRLVGRHGGQTSAVPTGRASAPARAELAAGSRKTGLWSGATLRQPLV
jgi:hypothetical protein